MLNVIKKINEARGDYFFLPQCHALGPFLHLPCGIFMSQACCMTEQGIQQNASPPPGQLYMAYLYRKAMTGNASKLPHDLWVITDQVS